MKIFAERLKDLRMGKGLSCEKLGKAIGTSGASISRWENCEYSITAEFIIKLAKYFGVSSDYLLGLED